MLFPVTKSKRNVKIAREDKEQEELTVDIMVSCWNAGLEDEEEIGKLREGEEPKRSWLGNGRIRGPRDLLKVPSQKVWMVCLSLAFLVALVHLTASRSTFLTKSIRDWLAPSTDDTTSMPVFDAERFIPPPLPNVTQVAPVTRKPVRRWPVKNARVAICLVGGARSFELTGMSIKEHVLDVYNNSDVFLHVPMDDDAHKLTLLEGASKLAMAKIFHNSYVPESLEAQEVLTGANSPHGIQGLLQYFRLVEGCLSMISSFEKKHKFTYDWIVRTRVDGYWSGPIPPLETLNPRSYHVPYGSRFGGFNDRLGIGTRVTSWPALSRLTLIPKLHAAGYRALNSEAAFKHQMDVSHISVRYDDIPFCILTARKYAWPLHTWGVPVASIKSKGALNGAKCKPCHSAAGGMAARNAINVLDHGWGWIHPVPDLQLCDGAQNAEPGWESMFDSVSGPDSANVRHKMMNRTGEDCVKEVTQFGKLWDVWEAPSPVILCKKLLDAAMKDTEPVG